jgi:hypothetical protein
MGEPSVDRNGIKTYTVTSRFQGPVPTEIRVLEPNNPTPGIPRRFLYVLPVIPGTPRISSEHSDGLEELRLLNAHNVYNLTLVAPSLQTDPWYGDHASDLNRRQEAFIINDVVPFGDSFASSDGIPQRWVIGFSKSGSGALSLILRNPQVFAAAAAFDSPVQLRDLTMFPGMAETFGTEENFARYRVPLLLSRNAEPFRTHNRIWISGNPSAWTLDMIELARQMDEAGIKYSWSDGVTRIHAWYSGWLPEALEALKANATDDSFLDKNANRLIAFGLRNPTSMTFRPGTSELWVSDSGLGVWNEINRITDAADGTVENFGWPCYEGRDQTASAEESLRICGELYEQPHLISSPAHVFSQNPVKDIEAGECNGRTATISGLAFYGGETYPSLYKNALFLADGSRNCLLVMFAGRDGIPDPATATPFLTHASNPKSLFQGPDGDLFYTDAKSGTLRRIGFSESRTQQ